MWRLLTITTLVLLAFSYAEACQKCSIPPQKWEDWKKCYCKTYPTLKEELKHQAEYMKNYARVKAHNEMYDKGLETDRQAMNEYSDIDPIKFRKRNGFIEPTTREVIDNFHNQNLRSKVHRADRQLKVPDTFDWRTEDGGKVSPVKQQGACGSCWAFSAVAAIESQVMMNTSLVFQPLSEQEIISCAKDPPNDGCNSGQISGAFQYMLNTNGIMSEADYPYTSAGATTGTCLVNSTSTWAVRILLYIRPLANDDNHLMQDLIAHGPISIAINGDSIQQYSSGIRSCSDRKNTHGMLLVGYGADESGSPYWIVKNSYGNEWGLQGFLYVARGTRDCGLTRFPSYPVLRGEPS